MCELVRSNTFWDRGHPGGSHRSWKSPEFPFCAEGLGKNPQRPSAHLPLPAWHHSTCELSCRKETQNLTELSEFTFHAEFGRCEVHAGPGGGSSAVLMENQLVFECGCGWGLNLFLRGMLDLSL